MSASAPPLSCDRATPPALLGPHDGRDSLERSRVWIVVPAYNEAPRIDELLADLCAGWPNVVVVDDGSTDSTAEIAREKPVWLLRHPLNFGQGAALVTGIRFSLREGADFVVTFDADGQHDVGDLEGLLRPLVEGEADISFGSRFLGQTVNMPAGRRLMLTAAVRVTRLLYGMSVTDAHNGLRAMTRKAAATLRITTNRMEHASEILERVQEQRLRWTEVPVTIRYTKESLAKGQGTAAAFPLALRLLLEKLIR